MPLNAPSPRLTFGTKATSPIWLSSTGTPRRYATTTLRISSRLAGLPMLRTVYSVPCVSEKPPAVLVPNAFSVFSTSSSVTFIWRISTGFGVNR